MRCYHLCVSQMNPGQTLFMMIPLHFSSTNQAKSLDNNETIKAFIIPGQTSVVSRVWDAV